MWPFALCKFCARSGVIGIASREQRLRPFGLVRNRGARLDCGREVGVLFECVQDESDRMPRLAVEDNSRMSLRIPPEEKTILLRAAALKRTDLTDFVRQHSLKAAREVIREAERLELSERDSLRVLALLENPPKPNAKLLAAAKSLQKRK